MLHGCLPALDMATVVLPRPPTLNPKLPLPLPRATDRVRNGYSMHASKVGAAVALAGQKTLNPKP